MTRWLAVSGIAIVLGLTHGPPVRAAAQAGDCLQGEPRAHAVATTRGILRETKASVDEIAAITPARFSESSLADVDGDGVPEKLLLDEHSGTANARHFLYLSNRGCRRFGGWFWASAESVVVLPERRNGLRVLRLFAKQGCAGLEGSVEELGWRGGAYRHHRTAARCGCPDQARRAPRSPLCPR
jgi:hypothetical protein